MNDAIEAAKRSLILREILVKSLSLDVSDRLNDTDEGLDVQIAMRTGISKRRNIRDDTGAAVGIQYLYKCEIKLIDRSILENPESSQEGEQAEFKFEASFLADYEMRDPIGDEAASIFGQVNVGYHVWPFWRELVQSTCNRVGITPISLPFYKPPKIQNRTEESAQ